MLSKLKNLPPPGEPLLIGVSGGADSAALLHALITLGYRPHVCHLNHQWRGTASDADAEFVRQLAAQHGLPATIEARQVEASEDAARQARLEFFESVAQRTGIHTLVLAHTANDQAETFLLRLIRGAGASGLVGIWPERRIGALHVIRPMLTVTRAQVQEYLSAHSLKYREDASNADVQFARNRIRHVLLPLLEKEFNPAIRETLLRTVEVLREEDRYLDEAARPHVADALHIPTLGSLPVALQRRVLRQWLNVEFEHIEAVRALPDEVHLPGGVVVYREYDWLKKKHGSQKSEVGGQWLVQLPGETVITELDVRLVAEIVGQSSRLPSSECFDADALGSLPFVRTWCDGDRFQPLGMKQEKKLQDFFVDEKVPRRQRDRVPLLCASDSRIAWVVGYRIAEPFKVTPQTNRIIRISAKEIQG